MIKESTLEIKISVSRTEVSALETDVSALYGDKEMAELAQGPALALQFTGGVRSTPGCCYMQALSKRKLCLFMSNERKEIRVILIPWRMCKLFDISYQFVAETAKIK